MCPTHYSTARDEIGHRIARSERRRVASDLGRASRLRRWNEWKMRWQSLAPQASAVTTPNALRRS